MRKKLSRRDFVKSAAASGISLSIAAKINYSPAPEVTGGRKAGIIGLDTSHSIAFTKALNSNNAGPEFGGYKVVAAYPRGSSDIKSSADRIPGYTEDVKKMGVEIVSSIDDLLKKVDVVFLETNDGRPHLEQAVQVFKAGKRMFIDKPITASLPDAISVFRAAEHYNVPVFTSSSLRFEKVTQEIVGGRIGKVLGAETYSPATIEKTHPDLYWYGIHGVESLFTLLGTGCKSVTRTYTPDTDLLVGVWNDDRIGTFRGTRSGIYFIGGMVFGEKENLPLGQEQGYDPLLLKIIEFFNTGSVPVKPQETLEIYAFMTAADESKSRGGAAVTLAEVMEKASREAKVY